MTDNVIYPDFITNLDIPPERVLNEAINAKLDRVVICGFDEDGNLYAASSVADGGEALWLLEKTKMLLLEAAY